MAQLRKVGCRYVLVVDNRPALECGKKTYQQLPAAIRNRLERGTQKNSPLGIVLLAAARARDRIVLSLALSHR